jgi:hypothetical protein
MLEGVQVAWAFDTLFLCLDILRSLQQWTDVCHLCAAVPSLHCWTDHGLGPGLELMLLMDAASRGACGTRCLIGGASHASSLQTMMAHSRRHVSVVFNWGGSVSCNYSARCIGSTGSRLGQVQFKAVLLGHAMTTSHMHRTQLIVTHRW